jgi:hypothetical protein
MKTWEATEIAYKNGYAAGFRDGQGVSINICTDCVCRPVCCVYNATGGVAQCEHYCAAGRTYATKLPADEAVTVSLTVVCSRCAAHMLPQDHVCPGCGAIMKESE